jgi:hypothetical protein
LVALPHERDDRPLACRDRLEASYVILSLSPNCDLQEQCNIFSALRSKCHHLAPNVITRLVRVIQNKKQKKIRISIIAGLPERVGQ